MSKEEIEIELEETNKRKKKRLEMYEIDDIENIINFEEDETTIIISTDDKPNEDHSESNSESTETHTNLINNQPKRKDLALIKIEMESSEEDEEEQMVKQGKKWMIKLRKICLCKCFGYKGTLIHVVALYFLLLAVLSGMTSALMEIFINLFGKLRTLLVGLFEFQLYKIGIWFVFTFTLGSISFLITKFISVRANGSGVPEMKSTLAGNVIPNVLSKKTLIAKVLGLTFSIGSGLWCGKIGAFIHISSLIAYALMEIPIFKFLKESSDLFHPILSVATGCGVTSAFGCPIGGLLFSVEVTSTYYPVKNYWYGTFTSIISTVVFRLIVNKYLGREKLLGGINSLDYSFDSPKMIDLLMTIILSVFCGMFAIFFIRQTGSIVRFKKFLQRYKFGNYPYIYLVFVIILTTLVCAPYNQSQSPFGYYTSDTLRQLFKNKSLDDLFVGQSVLLGLIILFLARFMITSLSISMPVPVGLFATNIIIGAAFGRLFGEIIQTMGIESTVGPNGFAIIGGASYVASLTQTFSASIVVMELIDNTQLLIPILMATVLSISLCRLFTVGIYDRLAQVNNLPLFPEIHYTKNETANSIMNINCVYITQHANYMDLKKVCDKLVNVRDRKIAVVNNETEQILIGEVTLIDIRKLMENHSGNDEIVLKFRECPLLLLRSTPVSEIHMLFVATETENAFVTQNGRLIGEVNKESLSDCFDKQMRILF